MDTPLSSSGWFSKEHLAWLASSYFLKYSHLSTSVPKIVLLDSSSMKRTPKFSPRSSSLLCLCPHSGNLIQFVTLNMDPSIFQTYFFSPDLSPALQVHTSTCLVVLLWVLQEADKTGHTRDLLGGSTCEVKRGGSWRRWAEPPTAMRGMTPVEGEG